MTSEAAGRAVLVVLALSALIGLVVYMRR